jgi:hypothetical protein
MTDPLLWNSLDEAAAWLTQETGDEWTVHSTLDAALRHQRSLGESRPTLLSVALPLGTVVIRKLWAPKKAAKPNELDEDGWQIIIDTADHLPVEQWPIDTPMAPLYRENVEELLVRGETLVGRADEGQINAEDICYDFVEPPLRATLAMVGIAGPKLCELAGFAKEHPARPMMAAAPKPAAATEPRRDLMAVEIGTAIAELGGAPAAAAIMGRLKDYAGKAGSCITEAGAGFVLWRDANGKRQKLDAENLRKRLERRAKRTGK